MKTIAGVSHEEYFERLEASDRKLEYFDGKVRTMPGTDIVHNILTPKISALLCGCYQNTECFVLNSQQLVEVPLRNTFVFPDVLVVCEKPDIRKTNFDLSAIRNPRIIVEVLSDSTEIFDRNEKFECYQTIESFREYVLINTKKNKVEVFKKIADNEWLLKTYLNDEDEVAVDDCRFLLKDLYKNIDQVRV